MKNSALLIVLCSLFLINCNNEPSLQKYFVKHTEDKNFIILDLSPEILKVDDSKMTADQLKAMETFEKVNVLAFKSDKQNLANYDVQRKEVNELLKDGKYQQLIKVGSGKDGASISFVGDEKHIDEFVLYGNNKEIGFIVVRIIGKDMSPDGIMALLSVLVNSNLDIKQLEPLKQLVKM